MKQRAVIFIVPNINSSAKNLKTVLLLIFATGFDCRPFMQKYGISQITFLLLEYEIFFLVKNYKTFETLCLNWSENYLVYSVLKSPLIIKINLKSYLIVFNNFTRSHVNKSNRLILWRLKSLIWTYTNIENKILNSDENVGAFTKPIMIFTFNLSSKNFYVKNFRPIFKISSKNLNSYCFSKMFNNYYLPLCK